MGGLLRQARDRAGLTKVALARNAGTSVAALVAYESGKRSPTVRTLDRLLAACGLQIRGELEPYLADVDALVDAMLVGGAEPRPGWRELAAALEAAGADWAFDAGTALAFHGLAARSRTLEVVAVVDPTLRRFLDGSWAEPVTADGQPLFVPWAEVDVARVGRDPMYTRYGFLELRFVAELPAPMRVVREGQECRVLGLLDVEQAHPALADVLARLRQRRTVVS